jgi:hypothetical protein
MRLTLILSVLSSIACGDGSSGYADKCKVACDPSAVMVCAAMDPGACQSACEAMTSGLSATCATCVTQSNAWAYGRTTMGTGASTCHGYAFPSVTDTSSSGCASACK